MGEKQVKRPDNYISLFDPEQIEIGANLTADGWNYAKRGSNAAQADWDLFDNAPTPRRIKSVNEEGYHIATFIAPELPPKKLVALAYIIEWKLIFGGKNSHWHPFTNGTDHARQLEVKGYDWSGETFSLISSSLFCPNIILY